MQFTKFLPNQGGRTKCLSGFVQRRSTMLFLMRVSVFYVALISGSIQLSLASSSSGQKLDETYVTVELNHESLQTLFEKIEKQTNLLFTFPEGVKSYNALTLASGRRSVKETLDMVLKDTPVTYKQINGNLVAVFVEGEGRMHSEESEIVEKYENVITPFIITGTVKDVSTREPLAGVNIIVKGTANGTTSDVNGGFSIEAEDNDILVFSFIGFKTFETNVAGRSSIEVDMEVEINSLQEVIVNAGYWEVSKKESTGNISKVTAEEIGKQPVTDPLQTLHGRMPGVYIQQTSGIPGSNFNVRVRGQNSISSGNDPLYIIDGVPFISGTLSNNITALSILGSGGANPLNGLNPNDIESIEVLKDADATAIYGSRGANGVILITTKKGKAGKAKLDLNFYTGISKVGNKLDLLNTQEYLQMRKEAHKNDETTPEPWEYDLSTWDSTRNTDWQKALIGGTAKTTNLQASISGGNSDTQFLFSGAYQSQGTVFPGDFAVRKISSHLSVIHNSSDGKFKAAFSINYVFNTSDLLNTDLTGKAMELAPNAPSLFDAQGKLNWENSTWQNPLSYLEARYKASNNNLFSNVVLSYKILKGLSAKINLGINDVRMFEKNSNPSTFFDPGFNPTPEWDALYLNTSSVQSWIVEPQLDWIKEIGQGELSFLVGATFQQKLTDQLTQEGFGFSSDALIEDINAAFDVNVRDNANTMYRYNAFFSRLNYSYKHKLIVNLTARRDGSSRFGPGKQFANFGAMGAAWIFSEEEFFKQTFPFISFGKVRSSFGVTGNDQIGDYKYLDTYSSTTAYQGINGLRPTRLYNSDFSWEVNKKFEAGLELGLIDDRILFSTSFYRNRSSSQLITYPLALTTGFNGVQANLPATVQNTGLEFELTSKNIKGSTFIWSTSFNITIPRNKLVKFPGLENSSYANTYVIGEPITIGRRFHYLGVNPQTGLYDFEDMNGDGSITFSDALAIVKNTQTFYGGLNNSIEYKGWRLDFFFQFVKQTGPNYFGSASAWPGSTGFNQPTTVLENRWREIGDEASTQKFTSNYSPEFGNYTFSDAVASDASFIRLKNVNLSYQLPLGWAKGATCRFYIQGQNLLTITNYVGLDPETMSSFSLPPLRTFTAGIQITL